MPDDKAPTEGVDAYLIARGLLRMAHDMLSGPTPDRLIEPALQLPSNRIRRPPPSD